MTEFKIPKWTRHESTLGPAHDPTARLVWQWCWGDRRQRFYRFHFSLEIGTDFWCWMRVSLRFPRRRRYDWTLMESWQPRPWYARPLDWVLDACMAQFRALEDEYLQSWETGFDDEFYGHP